MVLSDEIAATLPQAPVPLERWARAAQALELRVACQADCAERSVAQQCRLAIMQELGMVEFGAGRWFVFCEEVEAALRGAEGEG